MSYQVNTIKGLKLNKNILVIIGFVILSNVYYASAASEQVSSGQACIDNFYSNMEPSLSLAVRNNNPIINKGDTINLEIYISGYGHIANITKIYVTLPMGLIDDNTTFGNYYIQQYNSTEWTSPEYPMTPDMATGLGVYLPADLFQQTYYTINCSQLLIFTESQEFASGKFRAPIGMYFKTSKKASDGENKISIILTYSDGKKWYQDKEEVSVHINSWQEEHATLYTILIGFIGAAVIAVASFIWHSIGIKVKHPPKRNNE